MHGFVAPENVRVASVPILEIQLLLPEKTIEPAVLVPANCIRHPVPIVIESTTVMPPYTIRVDPLCNVTVSAVNCPTTDIMLPLPTIKSSNVADAKHSNVLSLVSEKSRVVRSDVTTILLPVADAS